MKKRDFLHPRVEPAIETSASLPRLASRRMRGMAHRKTIEELIEASSLGTAHARRVRARTSRELAEAILQRADELAGRGDIEPGPRPPSQNTIDDAQK